mgnify:CR=1 FL=1
MKPLKLPAYSCKIRESSRGSLIFDPLRRKYVALTPEEWVRQHFLNYLVEVLSYPKGLIQVEAGFRLNSMLRRADILVSDRSGQPVLIVECKAPEVKINQAVFDQIINYNFSYGVKYLVVTNGITHFSGKIDAGLHTFVLMDHIPDYETINETES